MRHSQFLRIEREGPGGSRHYVVHAAEPRFSVELAPDDAAPDRRGKGVIKRLCLPNSWAGGYDRYAPLLESAQAFFTRSFAGGDEGEPPARSRF